jgi:hypothetical protein
MIRQRQASVGSVLQSCSWFVCCFNLNRVVTVCFLDCRCTLMMWYVCVRVLPGATWQEGRAPAHFSFTALHGAVSRSLRHNAPNTVLSCCRSTGNGQMRWTMVDVLKHPDLACKWLCGLGGSPCCIRSSPGDNPGQPRLHALSPQVSARANCPAAR